MLILILFAVCILLVEIIVTKTLQDAHLRTVRVVQQCW